MDTVCNKWYYKRVADDCRAHVSSSVSDVTKMALSYFNSNCILMLGETLKELNSTLYT